MMRFLYMLTAINKAQLVALETQRKINLHDAKIIELAERRALVAARVARENNAVVLQDIQIDIKKLELERLNKEIHPPRWNPITGDYDL